METIESYEKVKTAIRRPWVSLFMDGRNEFGTHFLPVEPDGLSLSEQDSQALLESKNDEVERIFSDAERAGYADGCCIVVSCTIYEEEYGCYYELTSLDEDLTRLIFGSAEEQMAEIKAAINPEIGA